VAEAMAAVGDVELCYETFGDPSDPAMLLIMGLATQMIGWHDDFCAELAGRGFHVIRFDNRDIGRSTKLSHVPPPTTWQIVRMDRRAAGYTLEDMADDAVGLLDHLGIEKAHIVGASMGGMIAQHVAFEHPERVLSLVSIMSSTGHRLLGQPSLAVMPAFLARPEAGYDAYVRRSIELFQKVGSRKYFDERNVREIAELQWERGVDYAGTGRQLAAIVADGNRTRRLRRIKAPTLVIHGTDDKLVLPSGGRATARAIPGAKLMKIEHMGHDLPRQVWPQIIDGIVANTKRAGEREVVASPAT
jgi:pimeloyl-ACP methyl ester carboxylesterase